MEIDKLFSVEGKVALITGGSRGMGKMIAQQLRENGATVYIASHPMDEEENNNTAAELDSGQLIQDCISLTVDVTNLDSIKQLVRDVQKTTDHIDILINNAGTCFDTALGEIERKDWQYIIDLNLKSVFFMTQQFLFLLMKNATPKNRSSVINIGSIAGLDNVGVNHDGAAYFAAKSGQHHLSKVLAGDLVRQHINVNTIAPGPFETGILGRRGIDYNPDMFCEEMNPSGRFGEAEDIGAAVILLSSTAGSFIVGETLVVDGGFTVSSHHSNKWITTGKYDEQKDT
jgi:NAD(P)-dependent dehydrogenase (short-subunit alcohol dehydrogenase family)